MTRRGMKDAITKPARPPTALMRQSRPGAYDNRRIMSPALSLFVAASIAVYLSRSGGYIDVYGLW